MPEATKVLYDVSQAVKELEKLNSKVDQSGDRANTAFEKGGRGAKAFDKVLTKIPGSAGNVVRGLAGMSTGMATLAAGAGVVAGAIGSVIAQFIDFDDLLRDSLKSIESFQRATQTILDVRETVSSLGDAAVNRDFRLAQRSASRDQGLVNLEINEVERARDAAQERLQIFRDELSRRQGLLRDAVDREQALRDRLAARQSEGNPFGGFDADLQAAKLNQAAREAAAEGDLDRAEKLEQAAQQAASQAENQAFALGDAARTRDAINSSIEKEIDAASEAADQIRNQVDEQQRLVEAQEAAVEKELDRLKVLRQTSRELRAQRRLLRIEGQEARETQTADSAAREAEKNARDFTQNVREGGASFKETVLQTVSELRKFALDNADRQAALDVTRDAAGGAGRLVDLLNRLVQGQATASDFDAAVPDLQQLGQAVAELQAFEGIDSLSASQEQTLRRLEKLLDSGLRAFEQVGRFRDVSGDDELIREGSDRPTAEDQRALKDALLGLTDAIKGEPSRAAAAVPATEPRSQGAPQPATNAQASNVTVNANVRGGIIDAEVTREITRIIREELRKQTSAAPVA